MGEQTEVMAVQIRKHAGLNTIHSCAVEGSVPIDREVAQDAAAGEGVIRKPQA